MIQFSKHISNQHKSYFEEITDFLLHAGDNIHVNACLCKNAIPDDEHVRPETCRALCILKPHCNSNEVCVFVGLYYNKYNLILMPFLCNKIKEQLVGHNSRCLMVIPATFLSVKWK
jgi:hypothetical protein